MPSNYAHYRFGTEMLKLMPGDIRRTANRFRRLYDMGLHGPDMFFYYNPLYQTKIGAMGTRLHKQSGEDFFMRICRSLRMEPSEAGEAYLYGLLTHYCLDSCFRAYFAEKMQQESDFRVALESEFDRFLLEKDGKISAQKRDISLHMQLTGEECEMIARLYTGVKAGQVQTAVKNMARLTKLAAVSESVQRKLSGKGPKKNTSTEEPQEEETANLSNEELFACYQKAAEQFPAQLEQISAHLTYNAPLGGEFFTDFI